MNGWITSGFRDDGPAGSPGGMPLSSFRDEKVPDVSPLRKPGEGTILKFPLLMASTGLSMERDVFSAVWVGAGL